jgi:hypothetical protein
MARAENRLDPTKKPLLFGGAGPETPIHLNCGRR